MWFITINEVDLATDTPVMIEYHHINCHRRPTATEIRKSFEVDTEQTVTISPITFTRFDL